MAASRRSSQPDRHVHQTDVSGQKTGKCPLSSRKDGHRRPRRALWFSPLFLKVERILKARGGHAPVPGRHQPTAAACGLLHGAVWRGAETGHSIGPGYLAGFGWSNPGENAPPDGRRGVSGGVRSLWRTLLPLPRFHKSDRWLSLVAGRMRDRVSRPRYNDRI